LEKEFCQEYFLNLSKFVDGERKSNPNKIFPPAEEVWREDGQKIIIFQFNLVVREALPLKVGGRNLGEDDVFSKNAFACSRV
jgi:hypothetical protein